MTLIDEVKIYLKSGDGGNGCTSFRREKFIEFGGPDGGNGGKGGNIILIATKKYNNLYFFRHKKHIKAESGRSGAGYNKSGVSGKDIILEVPIGTQVYEEDGQNLIVDLNYINQKFIIAYGGKGGTGNLHYKSSTNRAPRYFTYGQKGEEKTILLKLKVISDVGIIGLPNSGKSSFLGRCTNSKTKIAAYPFTTLSPHLGVAYLTHEKSILLADIPGLITGAHLGLGLGHKFLKHIERCKVLLHLIDCTQPDVVETYYNIRNELSLYNKELLYKDEVVALSKCDLLNITEITKKRSLLSESIKQKVELLSIHDNHYSILKLLLALTEKNTNTEEKNSTYDPYKYLR